MQSYSNVWASGTIPFAHFVSRAVLQKSNRELMSQHVESSYANKAQMNRFWPCF